MEKIEKSKINGENELVFEKSDLFFYIFGLFMIVSLSL